MRRLVLVCAIAAAAALVAAQGAAAWHYTFQDFFDSQGSAIGAARATAKKCGGGGPQGVYDYRSFVHASGGDTELEVEVLARMSATGQWTKLKQVEVSTESSNIPPEIEDGVRQALLDFHETVFTRWKGPKHDLEVRHGDLVIFGNVSLEAGHSKTKFKPKQGC